MARKVYHVVLSPQAKRLEDRLDATARRCRRAVVASNPLSDARRNGRRIFDDAKQPCHPRSLSEPLRHDVPYCLSPDRSAEIRPALLRVI